MKKFGRKIIDKKTESMGILCCLFVFLVVILCCSRTMTVHAEQKVIKVGYIEQGDFIQQSHGEYTGYGVEYLDHIADITGWEYRFIWLSIPMKEQRGSFMQTFR